MVALIIIILFGVIQAIVHFRNFDSDNAYYGSFIAPQDYTSLFNREAEKWVKLNIDFDSKIKNSAAFFTFSDSNKPDDQYALFIYKIDIADNISLDSLIRSENKEETIDVFSPTYTEHYFNKKMGGLNIYNSYYSFPKAASIYLYLQGDSLSKNVLSNSLISYNIILRNFAIKYQENDPIDIEMKNTLFATKTKTNIVLLKKNDALYLLAMSCYNKGCISNDKLISLLDTNIGKSI